VGSARAFIAPLALAQFICSFAGSNMNVMINDISHDLHTDVKGVQTTITLFLLIMAVLMIPCSKLKRRHLDAAVDAFRHKTGADWLPTR
jgi:predicted MFS family arabinose efflux permease